MDPYEVIGAARGATEEELRRAYRRALRRAHPDTGGSDEEFRAVTEAWVRIAAGGAEPAPRPRRRTYPASAPDSFPDDGPRRTHAPPPRQSRAEAWRRRTDRAGQPQSPPAAVAEEAPWEDGGPVRTRSPRPPGEPAPAAAEWADDGPRRTRRPPTAEEVRAQRRAARRERGR